MIAEIVYDTGDCNDNKVIKVAQRIFLITVHFDGGRLEIEHHLDEYVASKPFILLQEKFDHLSELLLDALPDENLTLRVNIST